MLEQLLKSSFDVFTDLKHARLMSFSLVVCIWLYKCNYYKAQHFVGMAGMIKQNHVEFQNPTEL